MGVYDIPNIEHCTVEEVASGRMYRITAHAGWYIHLNDGDEETANIYKGAVVLMADRDFSQVVIIPESELPEDAVILETGGNSEIASTEATEADYISALENLGVNFNE